MEPHKFIDNYKCDCFQPHNFCTCARRHVSKEIFLENINDIAEHLIMVMNICGVFTEDNKILEDVIKYYFLHFEEIIHRIDAIPRKRLNKEDLIHDLARKCFMSRMETQIMYSIIKRAFKAFYHGTGLGGTPYNPPNQKILHTPECLWAHACQRTAQIYASYKGVFYAFKKNVEFRIKLVYRQLYDRITRRNNTCDDCECTCATCVKKIAAETLKVSVVTTGMHDVNDPYEAMYLKELKEYLEAEAAIEPGQIVGGSTTKHKPACTCPTLAITARDLIFRGGGKSTQTGSSQGPFDCRWFSISKEEYDADDREIFIKLPEEFPCTSPHSEEECSLECECTCDDCTCKTDCDFPCEDGQEMEHGNEDSDAATLSGVSTSDTKICDLNF